MFEIFVMCTTVHVCLIVDKAVTQCATDARIKIYKQSRMRCKLPATLHKNDYKYKVTNYAVGKI